MSLLRARESVMQHFRLMLRSFGVTEQQWRVLRALSSKHSANISELVDMTFLLGPSMSRILRELERRELIRRRTPDQDLRRGIISITAAGLDLIEKVGAHSETIYSEISRRYGVKKLAELQAMLSDLETIMSAGPIEPATAKRPRPAARRLADKSRPRSRPEPT